MNKPLACAAAATGVALIVAPSLVARLLLGSELSGVAVGRGQCRSVGTGIARGPGKEPTDAALGGMATYGLFVTLYLLYVGIRGEWVGPLLWPAMALYAVLTSLPARAVSPSVMPGCAHFCERSELLVISALWDASCGRIASLFPSREGTQK